MKILTRAIADAEERYYLANNEYTNNFDELDIDTPAYTSETTTENRVYRYFDWGFCNTSSKVNISCQNNAAKMEYSIYFLHGGNRRECVARSPDLSSVQNQICKAETGQTTATPNTDYNYTSWTY